LKIYRLSFILFWSLTPWKAAGVWWTLFEVFQLCWCPGRSIWMWFWERASFIKKYANNSSNLQLLSQASIVFYYGATWKVVSAHAGFSMGLSSFCDDQEVSVGYGMENEEQGMRLSFCLLGFIFKTQYAKILWYIISRNKTLDYIHYFKIWCIYKDIYCCLFLWLSFLYALLIT
jgi:hypothetical protein